MNDVLNQVLNTKSVKWLFDLGKKKSKQSAPWKWITTLLGFAVMLFFIGWTSYRSHKKARELAKLKHEKDVAKEEKNQIKLNKIIDKNQNNIDDNNKKLKDINIEIENIETELNNVTKEFLIEEEKINAIENWKDLDRYINNYPK